MDQSIRNIALDALSSVSGECRLCALAGKIREQLPVASPFPTAAVGLPTGTPRELHPDEKHELYQLIWDLVVQRAVTPIKSDSDFIAAEFLVHPDRVQLFLETERA